MTTHAGGSAAYVISLTNRDSVDCSTSAFRLDAKIPSGWVAWFSTGSPEVAPGATVKVGLRVTSPAGVAGGTYRVTITASHGADRNIMGFGSAVYHVGGTSDLAVTVTTTKERYVPREPLSVVVAVKRGATPVSRARVLLSLRDPHGRTTMYRVAATSSSGRIHLRLRTRSRATLGVYTVLAQVMHEGRTARGSTTFRLVENVTLLSAFSPPPIPVTGDGRGGNVYGGCSIHGPSGQSLGRSLGLPLALLLLVAIVRRRL